MARLKQVKPSTIEKEKVTIHADHKLTNWIFKSVVVTLCVLVLGVTVAMMRDLIQIQSEDDKILAIIAPAFNTVIGAFVGLLGGLSLKNKK
jgi:hypothetical protein